MTNFNDVDNIINVYERCEHGPWISEISK
jgi:hypothetical protein